MISAISSTMVMQLSYPLNNNNNEGSKFAEVIVHQLLLCEKEVPSLCYMQASCKT
jgi:hypothetical protein